MQDCFFILTLAYSKSISSTSLLNVNPCFPGRRPSYKTVSEPCRFWLLTSLRVRLPRLATQTNHQRLVEPSQRLYSREAQYKWPWLGVSRCIHGY
ncbi:hypothetical protein FOXYSP1_01253 [Fusarium oxysporum f. sp. phaseoli]